MLLQPGAATAFWLRATRADQSEPRYDFMSGRKYKQRAETFVDPERN